MSVSGERRNPIIFMALPEPESGLGLVEVLDAKDGLLTVRWEADRGPERTVVFQAELADVPTSCRSHARALLEARFGVQAWARRAI